jgi:gluconolactonase
MDVAHGRIFKILSSCGWATFIEYEGQPNRLKSHPDGRVIVADRRLGLIALPDYESEVSHRRQFQRPALQGTNDLNLAPNGDIFFTNQGNSALDDQSGQVFRLKSSGDLQLVTGGLNSLNGSVLNRSTDCLMVALARANQTIRIPLRHGDEGLNKPGVLFSYREAWQCLTESLSTQTQSCDRTLGPRYGVDHEPAW